MPDLQFTITDRSLVPVTEHGGETGHALWRTEDIDGVRVRAVNYSPGCLADHWCDKGHILHVLEGELEVELRDGRSFHLRAGMGFRVSDSGHAAHRISTRAGARVFVAD
ncbi:DHCW motif cupin fold protein [Sphingobium sp. AS12]|uniref:DHCW motif cupin fold protein n=1 Tax=Sphingobium sp. AS12 TaxID=2849495 RepID=UPI001C3122E6|nr:DHCW motif cupin fold protein [Sphingobium sp. AS12]MBV2149853.1 DHCW motif cupin fold protein [Sphingobium sp. AS12]